MGRMSKRKGDRGEREAAKAIMEAWPWVGARRGRQRSGDPEAPDVRTTLDGLWVESKRCEELSLYPAVEKAKQQCGDRVPVVVHRRNHREWLLIVPLAEALRFAEVLVESKGGDNAN